MNYATGTAKQTEMKNEPENLHVLYRAIYKYNNSSNKTMMR